MAVPVSGDGDASLITEETREGTFSRNSFESGASKVAMGFGRAKVVGFGLLVALAVFSAQVALVGAPAKVAAAPQGCPEHHAPDQAPEPVSHFCCAAGHQVALLTTLQPQFDLQAGFYVPLAQRVAVRGYAPVRTSSDESPGPPSRDISPSHLGPKLLR